MPKRNAPNIQAFLEKRIFDIFDVMESSITDNGVQFKSSHFKSLLEDYGVHHNFTIFYSPAS